MIQPGTQTASGVETGHDKLWADWQTAHPGVNPPNTAETLQQPLIITRTVDQAFTTQALGYLCA